MPRVWGKDPGPAETLPPALKRPFARGVDTLAPRGLPSKSEPSQPCQTQYFAGRNTLEGKSASRQLWVRTGTAGESITILCGLAKLAISVHSLRFASGRDAVSKSSIPGSSRTITSAPVHLSGPSPGAIPPQRPLPLRACEVNPSAPVRFTYLP